MRSTYYKYSNTPPNARLTRRKGSGMLVVAVVSAIIIALIALSTAKINQAAFNGLSSSKIALQAQQYAAAEADLLQATDYDDLDNAAHGREQILNSSDFESEIVLSDERDYSDEIKQRTGTIRIYRENENLPRYTLDTILLSVRQQASGVPIGTVITWPSARNPEDGTWLECNGQSCAAYPQLVAVLGKSTVPDYRGVFLRGYGSHNSTHYGTVTHSSDALGVLQGDAIRNITGDFPLGVDSWSGFTGAFYMGNHGNQLVSDDDGYKSYATFFNASRIVPTANENRPINIAVRYLIKAE